MQLAELLALTRLSLGSVDGREVVWPVNDFYIWALQRLQQHPARASLVGLVAAFLEHVEGAQLIAVDRDLYRAYHDDPDVQISPGAEETFELMFSLSFVEVRLLC